MTGRESDRSRLGADGDWASRLAVELELQVGLYEALDGLSAHQGALVEAEDGDGLLRVLGERQSLIERLESMNASARGLIDRWGAAMDAGGAEIDAGVRSRVRASLSRIEDCMGRITSRDAAQFSAIERVRDRISGELAGTTRARAAVQAYGRAGGSGGGARFQDRKV